MNLVPPRLRALAVTVVVTGTVLATPGAAHAAAPTGRYVALGDSYTSAPLVPDQVDLNCARSDRNYPSLVARAIGSAALVDVSCGGATTGDILNPGAGNLGLAVPAQIAAVTAATALVTIGIGGNDIGFSGIVSACAQDGVGNPSGTPCKDRYTAGGSDQLQARIAATAPKIAAVIQAVRAKAPNAQVVVVGYPAIVPDSGYGCWPTVPFAFGDVPYLRGVTKSLNSMLARTAAANGARYADAYTPSIGHDVCRGKSVRWVEGSVPENPAAPFHPNADGERGMADAVTARL
ncbi:SGNH/GDSL hydrolase family protein [Dactylosporangium roseum]|uniref:SGNH/GDSL hydrolase family protein n=1 Tax=Dactylosporangium roseum TaxID=47989 RepID=A0ABY5ZEL4_9ACTN|nr:SGNH/GDSL hydrolase family protein [Dactylosporangium roseum]UWZ40021.1 SGNH/GDSL hydrolase family protein [Dactylosporangium roseum]